uniref:transposase n=1 Tax=Actinopolyspora erythraea TaxID=414996 RepID=UPI000693B99B|nr:transposase [Actinopolyspora erythraea]
MSTTEEQSQEPKQPRDSSASMAPELVRQLAQRPANDGVDLVGPDGLLQQLTKQVLEASLEIERSEHLDYDKHEMTGRNCENSRNGTRLKTVTTEVGPVELDVPRDRRVNSSRKLCR